jgi:2-oxo-3-hexenedioate decarboxylase
MEATITHREIDASAIAPSSLPTIAAEAFAALGSGRQISSFSSRYPSFALDDAYRVNDLVRQLREARGETAIGRKIGFTNRIIWDEYDVHAPIWSYIYDRTVRDLAGVESLSLAQFSEPRIEPEIVFGLAAAPAAGMDEASLLSCIDWVALSYEIVQSIFPDWKFSAADTVAAYGLHGALLIGPRRAVGSRAAQWLRTLSRFEIDLLCDGHIMDHGRAANVLDGPLSALRYLVDLLARDPANPPLAAGEIVTTGTLTRALPIAPGETWCTALSGIALDGAPLRFAD